MTEDKNETYIEPIGFKGTPGEWKLTEEKNQFNKWYVVNDPVLDNEIFSLPCHILNYPNIPIRQIRKPEVLANAALLSNAKELAKALQDLITWQYCFEPRNETEKETFDNCCKNAKNILSLALNQK